MSWHNVDEPLNEQCFVLGKRKKSDGNSLKLDNDTSASEVSKQLHSFENNNSSYKQQVQEYIIN